MRARGNEGREAWLRTGGKVGRGAMVKIGGKEEGKGEDGEGEDRSREYGRWWEGDR